MDGSNVTLCYACMCTTYEVDHLVGTKTHLKDPDCYTVGGSAENAERGNDDERPTSC